MSESNRIDVLEGKYATVVIDPPWPITTSDYSYAREDRKLAKDKPYTTMTVKDIEALPIPELLDKDANVFLWTIQNHLHDAFHIIDAWKLKRRFVMVWQKNMGTQFYDGPSSNVEFVVVAGNGKAMWVDTKDFPLGFKANRGPHSAKPEAFYHLLRRVTRPPRLDVFNRRPIVGFDRWGMEAPPSDTPYQRLLQGIV